MELILPCGSAILNVNTANFVSRLVRLHVLTKTWCFLSSLSHMSPVCSSPLFPHVCCLLMSAVSSCLLSSCLLSPNVSCLLMSPFLISPIPLCNLLFLSLVLSFFRSIPVHCILFSHEPFMSPVTHVSYLLRSTISSCPLFPHVSCLLFHHVSYSLRSLVYSCLPHVPFTAGLLFPRVSCHFMSPVLPCLTYISSFRVPYPLKSAVSSSLLSLQVLCLPMSPIP